MSALRLVGIILLCCTAAAIAAEAAWVTLCRWNERRYG